MTERPESADDEATLPERRIGVLTLAAVQPARLFAFTFVAAAAAVGGRYSVGRLDPTTASRRTR